MPKMPVSLKLAGVARMVLVGAGLGMMVSLFGMAWRARGTGVPVDPHELMNETVFGTVGGALTGSVLYLTRSFRAQGTIQHYLSWIFASVLAFFILLTPEIATDGWKRVVLVSLFFGITAGLGLGLTARQVSQDDW
jgi:hypothetical protein